MLHIYENDNQQDWKACASKLMYAYNIQVHSSTNKHPFDPVLIRAILDFTLQPAVSMGKFILLPENGMES